MGTVPIIPKVRYSENPLFGLGLVLELGLGVRVRIAYGMFGEVDLQNSREELLNAVLGHPMIVKDIIYCRCPFFIIFT